MLSATRFPGSIITFPQRKEKQKDVIDLPAFPFSPFIRQAERPLFHLKTEGVPAGLLHSHDQDTASPALFLLC